MFIFLAIGGPALASFERDVLLSKVDSDECNADWIPTAPFKLIDLIRQIVNDSIDLFDHRFGQDFRFRSDFNCRDRAARDWPGSHPEPTEL